MPDQVLEILKNINQNLEDIKKEEKLPKLTYAKEIAEKYRVNLNTATQFCKKYGTNFGGYCIENDKFKEILQTAGTNIFNQKEGERSETKNNNIYDRNNVYVHVRSITSWSSIFSGIFIKYNNDGFYS